MLFYTGAGMADGYPGPERRSGRTHDNYPDEDRRRGHGPARFRVPGSGDIAFAADRALCPLLPGLIAAHNNSGFRGRFGVLMVVPDGNIASAGYLVIMAADVFWASALRYLTKTHRKNL